MGMNRGKQYAVGALLVSGVIAGCIGLVARYGTAGLVATVCITCAGVVWACLLIGRDG